MTQASDAIPASPPIRLELVSSFSLDVQKDLATLMCSEWGHEFSVSVEMYLKEWKQCTSEDTVPCQWVAVVDAPLPSRDGGRPGAASATPNPRVVGSIGVLKEDLPQGMESHFSPPLSPWLANFLIHPDFQGQGVGSAVLDLFVRKLHERYDTIYLCCSGGQRAAWYGSAGWSMVDQLYFDPRCMTDDDHQKLYVMKHVAKRTASASLRSRM